MQRDSPSPDPARRFAAGARGRWAQHTQNGPPSVASRKYEPPVRYPAGGASRNPLPLSITPTSSNATRRPRLGQAPSWRIAVGNAARAAPSRVRVMRRQRRYAPAWRPADRLQPLEIPESGVTTSRRSPEGGRAYPAAVGRGKPNEDLRGLVRGINPIGSLADLAYVPSSEYRSHGSSLGAKLRALCDGTRSRYVFS